MYTIRMSTDVWRSRGYVPHFDKPGAIQIITWRLLDSLPNKLFRVIKNKVPRSKMAVRNQLIEAQLDHGYGACLLARPDLAGIVQESILHFDGERYRALCWVVMPNHVHAIFELNDDYPLPKLVQGLKGFTGLMINRKLEREGPFWQREYFDRAVRDEAHFRNAVEYIHNNPVKAQLVKRAKEWQFSSAGMAEFTIKQQEVLTGQRAVNT